LQITLCREPFEFILIDNTYTEEELRFIFLELDFWALSGNLMGPEHTGTARFDDGTIKKKNAGVFLDNAYTDRRYSNMLKFNRKIFGATLDKPSTVLNALRESNEDTTLVSYYENGGEYKSHKDASHLTAVTYLYRQPKAFDGGDLVLTEYGYAFEPWFNRTYIFPSVVEHEVTPVVMKPEDCGKGLGRYCISAFINRFPRHEQVPNQV
jgi:Rps23 Pro-64 3,4-dihydroxylase Tpa1-like proline 4-hydroxylase